MRRLVGGALLVLWPALGMAADDELSTFRQRAPVTIATPAAFVRLPLTPEVYARTLQRGLADLRLVDARGERVPFALLAPRDDETKSEDRWSSAALYRLPPRPASGHWTAPVELAVDGGRITVRQRGAAPPPERSPGWLIDLGERAADAPAPHTLRLQWSGPAEFSAAFQLEHSADLKRWSAGGSGQVVALAASAAQAAALTQPDVTLPGNVSRFVRLVWSGNTTPPALSAAQAAAAAVRSVTLDVPRELSVISSTEPAASQATDAERTAAKRALHFDLGAVLPLVRLDVELPPAVRVLPVQVQLRDRPDARWQTHAGTVFYRLERDDGSVAKPPPVALRHEARYVRLLVDERAALPAAGTVRLLAQAQLASLVFPGQQGQPPLALLAGSKQAGSGALPLGTLVPELDKERPRFGSASLSAWSEVPEAVARAERDARVASLRPWLLWTVLIAGVAGLAFVVWRLARGARASGPA